jgi:hypothetical protein
MTVDFPNLSSEKRTQCKKREKRTDETGLFKSRKKVLLQVRISE